MWVKSSEISFRIVKIGEKFEFGLKDGKFYVKIENKIEVMNY